MITCPKAIMLLKEELAGLQSAREYEKYYQAEGLEQASNSTDPSGMSERVNTIAAKNEGMFRGMIFATLEEIDTISRI